MTIDIGDGPLRERTTIDWNNRLKHPVNAYVVGSVRAHESFERMTSLIATLP